MAEEVPKADHSTGHHAPTSTADLMSSAKILAEAAQSGFGKEGESIDKAKVAGAAEDILEAAKSYGKLDESSGVGQYVDKAEGYLHKYHSSESTPAISGEGGDNKEEVKPSAADDDDDAAAGAGDVINKAKKGLGGFFS